MGVQFFNNALISGVKQSSSVTHIRVSILFHHQLNGHEFDQPPEDSEGPGSLAYCSPWGCRESDRTQGLNNNFFPDFYPI